MTNPPIILKNKFYQISEVSIPHIATYCHKNIMSPACSWRNGKNLCLAAAVPFLYDRSMKRFLHSFKRISPAGLLAVRIILALCCAMVFAAFAICLFAGEPCVANFHLYRLAQEMADTPAGVLLLAGIALIILESQPR